MYLGDIAAAATLDFKFTTRRFSTGAPHTLAGTPAISVYKDNSTTQSTAGITLTVDFDSVTGLNNVRIDTSADGTFYSAGSNFQVVITTGTVDSVSVVGEVIGHFSIAHRPVQGLANSVITANAISANAITAAKIATDAIDADAIAADAITEIQSGLATAAALNTVDDFLDTEIAAIKAKTDQLTFTTANRVDSQVFGMEANTVTASAIATGAIDADAIAADAIGASELATDAINEIADGLLNRDMSTGTDSGSSTVRTMRQALRFLRNKFAISGGTLTVYKEDDATASWTGAITTTAGNPVTANDPAGP